MAHAHGGTRKPGRSRRFHQARGMDDPLIKSRHGVGCATSRANKRTDGDTAERRQRSEAGRTTRSRSSPIVPMKRGNQPEGPRGGKRTRSRAWESLERKMKRPQTLDNVSTKLQRIAELARTAPQMAFRTLAHHIDVEFLRVAYEQTRKDGAVGVDDQTAADYAADLERNLQSLLDRFKSGTYRAPPVRRVEIPKEDGATRPIGIPTFEDKVLQRAVAMVLSAVYEQDFLDCSYGFRPGRSAHQAIDSLWKGLMGVKGGWVIDLDIRHFFDSVGHGHLRTILDRRVRDGVIRRSIDKWLKAGVQQDGTVWYPDSGTPQGGVISPLLANIYLHEVLDVLSLIHISEP